MIDGSFIFVVLDLLCLLLGAVFLWSTLILAIGLSSGLKRYPKADKKLCFAVLICARNEEKVIRLPVKSILMSRYPREAMEVIVLADNCSDETARVAREAGATVWEKTEPSKGKGDVLEWGIAKVIAAKRFDAVAVFDADNVASNIWLDAMNNALSAGELIVTGRRMSSNATANIISGWYTVYWDLMNELSNRVRTNLRLSGKLTGTGFAFNLSILGEEGWHTKTMVEDVEFSIMSNIAGRRIAYVAGAEYADEQPITIHHMWRQLSRWATGCWQVVGIYFRPWISMMFKKPSFRLFDSYFALLTGMSVSFLVLVAIIALVARLCCAEDILRPLCIFGALIGFIAIVSGVTAFLAVLLSSKKRRPRWLAVFTFPAFSFILSATVLFALLRPSKTWKPIPHGN